MRRKPTLTVHSHHPDTSMAGVARERFWSSVRPPRPLNITAVKPRGEGAIFDLIDTVLRRNGWTWAMLLDKQREGVSTAEMQSLANKRAVVIRVLIESTAYEAFGWTESDVAKAVGVNRSSVQLAMRRLREFEKTCPQRQ